MKLSVCMITYNHEKFVAQAIDSVLAQETEFAYEVVIGEDCSTDGTRDILIDYQGRYPGRIRLLPGDRNLGMMANFVRTLRACEGEYIAYLEGDDYWTSTHKLQKQVDVLDADPSLSLSGHKAEVVFEAGAKRDYPSHWPEQDPSARMDFADVLRRHCIPALSMVFRGAPIKRLPQSFTRLPVGDYPLLVLYAMQGDIHYSPEVMGVYRRHAAGVSASWLGDKFMHYAQAKLAVFRGLSSASGPGHRAMLHAEIGRLSYEVVLHCEATGDARRARSFAWQRIVARHFVPGLENPIRQLARLYVPGLHRLARSCKHVLGGRG